MSNLEPNTILLLRQLERKTQTKLASDAKTTQASISKVLNGQIEFSDELARSLAIAEDYPSSFFSSKIELLPITSLTYRHTSRSSLGELNSIGAEYSTLFAVVQRYAESIGLKSKVSWIDEIAPREDGLDMSRIEELAQKTRFLMGLTDSGPIGNVTRSLERQGIVVAPLHGLSRHGEGRLNSDGVTYPRFDDSVPVIAYSPNKEAGDRERFTRAHELAHLILHRYRKPETYKQMESEAHQFAGAFLMPLADAKVAMNSLSMLSDFMMMKSGWGISISALVSRARNAGIISYDRYRSLYMQISARGWRKQEPVEVGLEQPLLLKTMLSQKYGDTSGAINSFSVEKDLGIPFRYLDMWSGGLNEQGKEIGFRAKRFEDIDH